MVRHELLQSREIIWRPNERQALNCSKDLVEIVIAKPEERA
jgi:hypothetical protein